VRRSEGWIHGRDSPAGIATSSTPRVQFSGISSFSFVLISYVLLASLCMFLHSVHSVLLLFYITLLFMFCSFICNTATGHRPNCIW
jgi:hypothetical protein